MSNDKANQELISRLRGELQDAVDLAKALGKTVGPGGFFPLAVDGCAWPEPCDSSAVGGQHSLSCREEVSQELGITMPQFVAVEVGFEGERRSRGWVAHMRLIVGA